METILVLLALFGIKHFLADYVFQTPKMLEEKGTYGAFGGLQHAYVHGLLTGFVLLPVVPSLLVICKLAIIDGIIHYHVDWTKKQMSSHYTIADKEFWFWFGLDQTLHYLTYIGIITWVTVLA
jgi:hypothetical protein